MTSTVHRFTAAFGIALLVPGLLAGLSFCGMPECPARVVEPAHHCPQADSPSLSTACCGVQVQAPATPVKATERPEVGVAPVWAAVAVADAVVLPTTVSVRPVSPSRPPLDPLSQSSILRI